MMAISPKDLVFEVIRPGLESMDIWTRDSEEFILGIASVESNCGTYLRQQNNGPGMGIWQMEPRTQADIHVNFLAYKQPLETKLYIASGMSLFAKSAVPPASALVYNLRYAMLMARMFFMRMKEPIPPAGDLYGQAQYWKKYYNTQAGKGDEAGYVMAWKKYVKPTYQY